MLRKTKNNFINSLEAEKFVILSSESKINIIKEKIDKINEFYSNINEINDKDIANMLEPITNAISNKEILDRFKTGIIFLDELKDLINEKEIEIEESEINNIFAFFDEKNKNYFIFVRDIIDFFKEKVEKKMDKEKNNHIDEFGSSEKINLESKNSNINKTKTPEDEKKVINTKLSKDKYILIFKVT